jgi:hypothetical protein
VWSASKRSRNRVEPINPNARSYSWRQKAEQTRELAYRLTAKAKPRLLEIADAYDGLQD